MAVIDYGALLRVDGKFINKNKDLFMETSDTGYTPPEKIQDYFVYAGDKNLLLAFYKGIIAAVKGEVYLFNIYNSPFISQTVKVENTEVKISHLDSMIYCDNWFKNEIIPWKEHVKRSWIGATGKEKLSDLENGKREFVKYRRRLKKAIRFKGYHYRTNRWIAEWNHAGRHYEVIFGYGIDPDEDVWNHIKNDKNYGFTNVEIETINQWFAEKEF